MSDCHGCAGCAVAEAPPLSQKSARPHVVAIIGPPNSGKSTLFNRLTGLRQKVANFPGVTVEQRVGKARMPHHHHEVVLVDLPGVYSLNPRSEDEQVTRDVLAGAMPGIPKPDALLLILDCTNLGPSPGAGRADPQFEIADAGHPQHGGRSEKPRRPRGHGRAGQRTRFTGCAHQRFQRPRRRKSLSVHGRYFGRHHFARAPTRGASGFAGHSALPPMGARCRNRRSLSRPRAAYMDAPSGFGLLASCRRSSDLPDRGGRSFPNHLHGREAFDGWPAGPDSDLRPVDRARACRPPSSARS